MPKEGPKVEITGYYSYFRFNPENSGTLNSHSLNGGGADIGYFFSKMFGIKAEFSGYQSLTAIFTNNISNGRVSANFFTYNARLVAKFRSDRSNRSPRQCLAELIPVFAETSANSWQHVSHKIRAIMRLTSCWGAAWTFRCRTPSPSVLCKLIMLTCFGIGFTK
jgi:hypothetical protein